MVTPQLSSARRTAATFSGVMVSPWPKEKEAAEMTAAPGRWDGHCTKRAPGPPPPTIE